MTCNTLVRDLNVVVARFDDRRIEVIANGLPLWNGAQLAVDTTIVPPLTANGVARSLRDPARPIALQEARRRKEATYPELVGNGGRRVCALAGPRQSSCCPSRAAAGFARRVRAPLVWLARCGCIPSFC